MAVPASQLRGGVDYPRTRLELDEFFPDDAACLEYVEGLRWPEGFVCVGCGGLGEVWRASRGRLVCPHCRRQTSVLAGTVFHRTRSPLRLWFLAAWGARVGADRRVHIRHSTGDVIPGKKQSKFNWDCTICRTCR